ncbi:MAG: DUF4982 domain-containing protein [Opitutaceae bacterium]|nr:DUF4982 domain-containing protein [Opitutaceae bacterium]
MSPLLRSLLALLLAGLTSGLSAATTDFSTDWRFHLGDAPGAEAPGFAEAAWERVAAPHTARLEARVTDHEAKQQWEGVCWYRKTFNLPSTAAGQVVLLRFEGAMNVTEVFVNGQKLATSIDGYTPFVVDLTEVAKRIQPITVALRLDNRATEVTGPKPLPVLDFHLYHGLYRTVALIIKPTLHITDEILESKPASGGVFVTYPQVSAATATVSAQVHVRNRTDTAATFTLVTSLRSLDGKEVAHHKESELRLAAGEDRAFTSLLKVRHPRLWSPRSPTLHDLEVSLLSGGQLIDSRHERIGIRRFELGQGGLLLNGEKLFLRGVNRHQEYPYIGNAVPARAQYRDALKIKQAGFDCIRLSHYPQSPDFLAACDELGLVTIDGILGWQYNASTPAFVANRLASARALVRRDRNHPSALLWELCLNESSMAPAFVAALHAAGHEEYPGDQMATVGWLQGYDVQLTARQHGSTKQFHGATFPCFVSEYGDWEYYAGNAGLNQEAWGNLKQAERTSRQSRGDGEVRLLQQATNLQEAHNENRGTQAFGDGYWVMYDYNRGYASDLETSGIMDLFRLPKFSHAFFQSQRDPREVLPDLAGGPMVFAATYWTDQSPLAVRVFSNCDEVELRLNGESLGRQKPDQDRNSTYLAHPPFTFKIGRFKPGVLEAVAYLDRKAVARHRVQTPGTAERLALAPDLSGRPLAAGGDLVFIYARIVDTEGTVVPGASRAVRFSVEGDAQLIGDNPATAEAGIATILLKTGPQGGTIRLKAAAGALQGQLKLKTD